MADPIHCSEFLYSGNVQGVGFRYRVNQIATNYLVVGHVKNLADGRVQVIAAGVPAEVANFAGEIAAQLAPHIRDISSTSQPALAQSLVSKDAFRIER